VCGQRFSQCGAGGEFPDCSISSKPVPVVLELLRLVDRRDQGEVLPKSASSGGKPC